MEVMERCLFQCNLVALKGVLSNDVSTLVALTACLDTLNLPSSGSSSSSIRDAVQCTHDLAKHRSKTFWQTATSFILRHKGYES